MTLKDRILGFSFTPKEQKTWAQHAEAAQREFASESGYDHGQQYPIIETIYDGEKTRGELGAPLSYLPDYTALSYRSWQAYTESDLAQIIIKAHVNWVIGSGLKLQAEPIEGVIGSEGFDFDKKVFIKNVEERFRLYAKTNNAAYSQMINYNQLQRSAFMNAAISGDLLCIEMLVDGLPAKRLIDGTWVQQPGADLIEKAKTRGNKIVHGVEIDPTGKHLRFYVLNKKNKDFQNDFTIIEAYGKNTKRLQSYLLYGTENRIDSVRGMPLIAAVIEKMKKLDRYNEALVASAEESAKVPWFFAHDKESDGTNPDLAKQIEAMSGTVKTDGNVVDMNSQVTMVKRTFEKDAINLPVGATMKRLDGGMERDHEAFSTSNFIFICAACEVPYEVALMKYVNSFSSSRMASQTWLTILKIKRSIFNDQFNKPFYKLFLDSQILSGKIKADGYFTAQNKGDIILLEAYQNCRFTGPGVPQADPGKEVKAELAKIEGNISTHDESMERLGGGDDFETTVTKLSKEKELINELMPEPEPVEPVKVTK